MSEASEPWVKPLYIAKDNLPHDRRTFLRQQIRVLLSDGKDLWDIADELNISHTKAIELSTGRHPGKAEMERMRSEKKQRGWKYAAE